MTKEKFKKWSVGFTATVLKWITIAWIVQVFISVVLIFYAIQTTGQFSYLDAFITETNETFRVSVVALLITRTIGNVFEHNNGVVFGESRKEDHDSTDSSSTIDGMRGDDWFNRGSD